MCNCSLSTIQKRDNRLLKLVSILVEYIMPTHNERQKQSQLTGQCQKRNLVCPHQLSS